MRLDRQLDQYNVLIVNQHQSATDIVIAALQHSSKYGYDFQTTTSIPRGKELLELRHDLIISGLGNGWGDGYGFLEYVAKHTPRAKRIVMTGYGEGERRTAMSRGAQGFIPLPSGLDYIVDEVERVMELPEKVTKAIPTP